MHYLSEENVFIFVLQVLVLLATAKTLGALCQRYGVPSVAGEVFTGIVLGPSILGRALPALEARLFPADPTQHAMLETVSWFGVLFMLLATGFEVSISTVWKQGKACILIGVIGISVSIATGCAVFWWLPARYWGENATHLTFTLFLATAAGISALAVIARVFHDLEILKSDLGLTALSAFIVHDVLGWMAFTAVIGMAVPAQAHSQGVLRILYGMVLLVTVCLTVGTKLVGTITVKLQQSALPQPGTTLTFICCLGLLCGALVQWTGIHAILGFFLAGIMAGNTPQISENTRQTISQMVHAVFVPIFFASIGLKTDFLANFDVPLVAVITAVAIGGKMLGGWAGARVAGLTKQDAFSVGVAHIPGGAVEIIVGIVALEQGLIPESVFVAIVFAALSSSIAVGPLLAWSIKRREPVDVGGLLLRGTVELNLKGANRWDVIGELCRSVARSVSGVDAQRIESAVHARESIMGTGLEKGVAVPHARLAGLDTPIVAFGRSRLGIDWDCCDGRPVHFVFLILTPEGKADMQVQILSSVARVMMTGDVPQKIRAAEDPNEVRELLNAALGLRHFTRAAQPA